MTNSPRNSAVPEDEDNGKPSESYSGKGPDMDGSQEQRDVGRPDNTYSPEDGAPKDKSGTPMPKDPGNPTN